MFPPCHPGDRYRPGCAPTAALAHGKLLVADRRDACGGSPGAIRLTFSEPYFRTSRAWCSRIVPECAQDRASHVEGDKKQLVVPLVAETCSGDL